MIDLELYETMLASIDQALDNDNAFGVLHNSAMDVIAELNNRIKEEKQ